MRMRGARRFQMGGVNNPVLAAGNAPIAPSGVNPLPAVNVGGPAGGPFQANAPAAGLGAAAPGLNPAAIQQAMAQRRMQAGMGMPGAGMGGPTPMQANPLAQQLAARGAMPGAGGPAQTNPFLQQMAARGALPTPTPVSMGAAPAGPTPNPGAISPALAASLAGAGVTPGMARGGKVVAPQWGDTDDIADRPERRARGGRISKFNSTKPAPGNLATHPGAEKKAKGGVLKRRPKAPRAPKAPPPFPPGGDQDSALPPPATAAPAAAAALAPPAPAGPPPGMRRGGRWKGGAVAKKKGGAVRRRPPGAEPDEGDTEAMAGGGKWIQKAIKKPGALHAQLGVPPGKKIPAKKLAKAAKASGKLGQRARLAETLKGLHKAKGGKCVVDKDKDEMRQGGKCKMAAGGAAKQRRGFPKTIAPLKRAEGGRIRGCGAATKGCKFSGIY